MYYQPFSDNSMFETKLNPLQELAFQQWAPTHVFINDQIRGLDGTGNYDWRGQFLNPIRTEVNVNDGLPHGSDFYKKPSHPTLTEGSQYSIFGNPGTFLGGFNNNLPSYYLAPKPQKAIELFRFPRIQGGL